MLRGERCRPTCIKCHSGVQHLDAGDEIAARECSSRARLPRLSPSPRATRSSRNDHASRRSAEPPPHRRQGRAGLARPLVKNPHEFRPRIAHAELHVRGRSGGADRRLPPVDHARAERRVAGGGIRRPRPARRRVARQGAGRSLAAAVRATRSAPTRSRVSSQQQGHRAEPPNVAERRAHAGSISGSGTRAATPPSRACRASVSPTTRRAT